MSYLARLPTDEAIVDMIRSGVNTIPGIASKIYGRLPEADWIAAKAKVLRRLNMLSKYRIVRKTERTIQLGYGRNVAKVWEVVE